MAFVFKDLKGIQHEFYNSNSAEEVIDVVTGEVVGYRVNASMSNYDISKETYEALIKVRK